MSPSKSQEDRTGTSPPPFAAASRALAWLWQALAHARHPWILGCGPAFQPTLDVLLKRGAKVYLADLLTPILWDDAAFWSQKGKSRLFLVEEFLAQIPAIPPESLSAVFCWQLLDLLPREVLPSFVERLYSYLQPKGVLFCLLREPYLVAGADTRWWLESLTVLASSVESPKAFPYPALTNREMERLVPGGDVKTFLTRFGRREVLAIR